MIAFLTNALAWAAVAGPVGKAVYLGLYVLACLTLLPSSVLIVAAGAAYGPWQGFLLASAGSILGPCAAFLLARYLLGGWVRRRLHGARVFKAVTAVLGREGWKIVLLTRLSPVLPLNVMSYTFGLTSMGLAEYAAASWAGRLPSMVLYLYLGASLGATATKGVRALTPAALALYAAGLAATVVAVWQVSQKAKRALSSKTIRT